MTTTISNLRRNLVDGSTDVFLFDRVSDTYQPGQAIGSFLDGQLRTYQNWDADFPFASISGVSEGTHSVYIAQVDPDSGDEVPDTRSNTLTFNTADYPIEVENPDPGGGGGGGGGTPEVPYVDPNHPMIKLGNLPITHNESVFLTTYNGCFRAPAMSDLDYAIQASHGQVYRAGYYEPATWTLALFIDGDCNEDGSPYLGDPIEHANALLQRLISATRGLFTVAVTRGDRTFTSQGHVVNGLDPQEVATQSSLTLSVEVKFPPAVWTETTPLELNLPNGETTPVELAELNAPIVDAEIYVTGFEVEVMDVSNLTFFHVRGDSSDTRVDAANRFNPLEGSGKPFTDIYWGKGGALTVGGSEGPPRLLVTGGTARLVCHRKVLIP